MVIYNYVCHICGKGFLNSNFCQAVIDKYQCLMNSQNLHTHKIVFFSMIGTLKTNCLYLVNVMTVEFKEYAFSFQFCQLLAVNPRLTKPFC